MSQINTDGINYQSAHFVISAAKLSQCPPDLGSEVAFAGRSNSGKSSAINAITNQKSLARTSKTPGRTQLINFFGLPLPERRLVDLPGYGFAKVNIEMKREWQRHLEDYLRRRRCLRGLVLVMDVRHPLTEFDRMMLAWACEAGMPVHILLTKADKLKRGPAKNSLLQVRRAVQAEYGEQVTVQLFSALKKDGIDQARARLDDWLLELPEDDEMADMY